MSAACTASLPADVRAMEPLLRLFLFAYGFHGYLRMLDEGPVHPSWIREFWRSILRSASLGFVMVHRRHGASNLVLPETAGPNCPFDACEECGEVWDEHGPYVCPECYAVCCEPHDLGCDEGERERRDFDLCFDDDGRWSDEDEDGDYLDDGQALTAELQREDEGTEAYEGEGIPW